MKKIVLMILFLSLTFVLTACNSRPRLRLLNWGEYINDEVIEKFEQEYGYKVVVSTADSNELFYSKIKSKTTAFDLVIPGDYMIEKMVDENMLIKLDHSLLPNLPAATFMDGVNQILESMNQTTLARTGQDVDYLDYAIPYFWGTFGIIYNNRINGLEAALNEFGWDVYFGLNNHFPNARRGMHEVAQFAYAAALMTLGNNPNEFSTALLEQARTVIQGANFIEWGNDTLKRNIEANNLDMAFTYTGDYLDRLYIQMEDEGKTLEEVRAIFDIYIPDTTLVFVDCVVIPNTARNIEGAHQFINFLLDPEIAALNAEVVGYSVTFEEAFAIIMSYLDSDNQWRRDWAMANSIYYNMDVERTYYPLTTLHPNSIDSISTMIQNVKTSR